MKNPKFCKLCRYFKPEMDGTGFCEKWPRAVIRPQGTCFYWEALFDTLGPENGEDEQRHLPTSKNARQRN